MIAKLNLKGCVKTAIQKLIQVNEAKQDITDEYGTYYQVIGELEGVNDCKLYQVRLNSCHCDRREAFALYVSRKLR
ncbi:hypothetical protein [Roseofilum capinflatum]|uniref:Transposase n=1 Tax=Roseofilum capinflatum BLCC-M114 TaxID=3022440 RepID=A0ABT7B045_9CYAN|nr:hypothetical protein [Roseofilum capinflatum]MDJ1172542.1 hypothetical protein [Roseofilum capinflatum BLCC-M114]